MEWLPASSARSDLGYIAECVSRNCTDVYAGELSNLGERQTLFCYLNRELILIGSY
jgi:hypothetical protein